jgi:hypothetical protein
MEQVELVDTQTLTLHLASARVVVLVQQEVLETPVELVEQETLEL